MEMLPLRQSVLIGGALSAVLSGCAATTGRGWVQEPEDANLDLATTPTATLPMTPERGGVLALEADDARAPLDTHPRLDHVVSLGESQASQDPRAASAAMPASGPVVVNIVNYGGAPYSPYVGYGVGYSSSRATAAPPGFAPRSAAPSAAPALGGDWARPPSYGPTFPFHTAPARPWH